MWRISARNFVLEKDTSSVGGLAERRARSITKEMAGEFFLSFGFVALTVSSFGYSRSVTAPFQNESGVRICACGVIVIPTGLTGNESPCLCASGSGWSGMIFP